MAKSDKKDLYNTSVGKVKQSETEYNNLFNKIGGRDDTTWDRATQDYGGAYGGYKSYAEGGGLTQEDKDRMQGAINALGNPALAGYGGGGGISAPRLGTSNYRNLSSAYASAYRPDYSEADTGFRKLASETGGFDKGQLDQIYGNIAGLTEMGKTGGITDQMRSDINRKSILEQEETGGYSAQDRALIRAKSASSSPAYFDALKDNLQRQRSSTGNLANAGAVDFKLARQAAQQQGQDRINAEIGLGDSIRKGRESAGQFLSNQNYNLAGLQTANQLQGAQAAGNLGLSTQQGITSNQLAGLGGLQESQTGLGQWGLGQAGGLDQFGLAQAGGLDQWDLAQAQMDMQASAANAGRGDANAREAARANAEYQQWLTEYGNQQKQYGIGGLHDLYNTNLGASQNYTGMGLDALNSKYGTQGSMLGLATQNRGSTLMENVGTIGNVVGAVGGALTGIGAVGGLAKTGLAGLGGTDYAKYYSKLRP